MSNSRIPTSAGTFCVLGERRKIGGRERRVRVLQFTTADGYVGESRTFNHREAYENAVAERARVQFEVTANRLPKPYERCDKPAPAATLLHAISETLLFSEVERRGYEVAMP